MPTSKLVSRWLPPWFGLLLVSCMPLQDLDSAASGKGTGGASSGGAASVPSTGGAGGVASTSGAGGVASTGGTGGVASTGGTGGFASTGGAGGVPSTGGVTAPPTDPTDASPETGGSDVRDVGYGSVEVLVDAPTGGTGGETGLGGAAAGGVTGSGGRTGVGGSTPVRGGTGGSGGVSAQGGSTAVAPDLPDIDNSPVSGEIIYSAGASWDIDGVQWPAFEVHTPTASYWLVKADAAIVSITDSAQIQWINFSSGFRPNRGVPNLGGCCQPGDPSKLELPVMTTEVDPGFTVTSTHLRLVSKSADASYWLVWDFFLTHVTLTINRAAKPFGFTYRGVPGGALGAADQLVVAGSPARSASNPYTTVLPGPSGWAYLTDPATNHALFMVQHSDDTLSDTYRVADGDTAMFVFGGGQITQTPVRFSLGLVDSCQDQDVTSRIGFVQNAVPGR